jgi:hypothetical protein
MLSNGAAPIAHVGNGFHRRRHISDGLRQALPARHGRQYLGFGGNQTAPSMPSPRWRSVRKRLQMNDTGNGLRQSALMMRITGWGLIIGLALAGAVYPPGFMWGDHPMVFPFIFWQHPDSPYDGLHPYLFMIGALYIAWAILMIRGAKNPRANAALFDYGILANLLHGGLMIPRAIPENTHTCGRTFRGYSP